MSNELKLEIPFEDLEYSKRREILRYDYMHNAEHHKAVKILAFEVQKHLYKPIVPELLRIDTIIKFLIDGFLAYEISGDLYNPSYIELDVLNMEVKLHENKTDKIWIIYKGNNIWEKEMPDDKIIYLAYCSSNCMEFSFLQSVYQGLISPSDIKFIKKHAKEIARKFTKK
jgi:hypothetical protein